MTVKGLHDWMGLTPDQREMREEYRKDLLAMKSNKSHRFNTPLLWVKWATVIKPNK